MTKMALCPSDGTARDAIEQEALRQHAKTSQRKRTAPVHFVGPDDTFDVAPGGLLVLRNNHVKPIAAPSDGEYG